uniref:Retrovirus-related Pol polyprotein from transposon TNT 1-94 n=1 Tax=Tanacetum cinerariifolium TaxID=118510 RepID=A0A6L2MZ36_TANCI|nr:retrovirus-related Pol polyprotein from transposon TNT 1-94 [Tanacetum cinerariifolium]
MTAGQKKPEEQWTIDERKTANLDQQLKSLIISVLPDDQMNYVINCLTVKSTWNDLILYHEVPFDVKESRVMDLKLCYNTFKFKEDFQYSPDDEEGTRSSHEYLNDLEEEYQGRALLAKSKRFFKKDTQRFRSAKATDQTECHKCDKKGHFTRDSDKSLVCSTPLPPLQKLDGAEPTSGPKTIKSIFRSKSTLKAETLKSIIINKPSSAPAKGNKNSLASTVNSAPAEKGSNPRNPQHAFKRCEASSSLNHITTDHYDIEWFKRGKALQAKKVKALKSTKTKSSNANRSKTPTKSGCSRHMTGVKSYLHKYVKQPGPKVVFGDDSTCTNEGYGSIKCNGIVFTKLAFMDGLKYNLISISQLYDAKYIIQFNDKRGTIFNSNKEVVMIFPRVRDVYVLDMTSFAQESCFFAKAFENLYCFWYKILAHLNFKIINKLAKQNLVIGLPSLVYLKDKPCPSCKKGKHHKASFKTKQTSSIKKCLHLLHMDLFGHVTPRSINHEKYTLVIVNEYSRPNIQFSTCLCARYQANLKESHLIAVKRIFRYQANLKESHLIAVKRIFRDHILKGDIELYFISTQYQLVDIFTKPLDEPTFKRLIVELGMPNIDSKHEASVKVDYAKLIWEDIIHKINKKTREKVDPYPRFISLLLEYMMPEYENEKLTINPTQVFSIHNWALKPNQAERPPFTDHVKAICKLDVHVKSKALNPSSLTEEETQSSSAKEKRPIHPSPLTPVVGEMHKKAQQVAGGPTSLGATNKEGAHPQLSSADSTTKADPGNSDPNDSIPSK